MKSIRNLLLLSGMFSACHNHKVTEIHIQNHQTFPIQLEVQTGNCHQRFPHIDAGMDFHGLYDWTDLQTDNGPWLFILTQENGLRRDTFRYGVFEHAELMNYADLEYNGSELKIKLSD